MKVRDISKCLRRIPKMTYTGQVINEEVLRRANFQRLQGLVAERPLWSTGHGR